MRALLFSCVLLLLWSKWLAAERNEDEEAICQPFLTSRESSPLMSIEDLPRDLRRDEDGEFSCEVVLQDPDLPGQIRVTIHEGLHYLALRHVQMGLEKHKRVAHHARQLAALLPGKHSFSFKAGFWSLDPHVDQAEKAVEYLHSCVHGRASADSSPSPHERTDAHREYIRALMYSGRYTDAAAEVEMILAANVADFNMAFQLRAIRQLTGNTTVSVAEALNRQLYDEISRHFSSSYEGFVAPADGAWAPHRFDELPSQILFEEHQRRREPFVVSLGQRLDVSLKWNTAKWSRDYLVKTIGLEEVSVELPIASSALFGHGPAVRRQTITFEAFVGRLENATTLYLNTQKQGSGEGFYRPPLHKIMSDIKAHPPFLPTSVILKDMIDINLWMGGSSSAVNASISRLHADPADNIYIVLKGQKDFTIFSPDLAAMMQTVGPAFAVAKNGHPFFLKPPVLTELQALGLSFKGSVPPHFVSQRPVDSTHYHFSDLAAPLSEPSLAGRAVSLALQPGDLLYLPCGWFHTVTSAPGEHMVASACTSIRKHSSPS